MSAFDKLTAIIEKLTRRPAGDITPATPLGDVVPGELGQADLYIACEFEFRILLKDSDLEFIGTVGQLAEAIDRKLKQKPRAA